MYTGVQVQFGLLNNVEPSLATESAIELVLHDDW